MQYKFRGRNKTYEIEVVGKITGGEVKVRVGGKEFNTQLLGGFEKDEKGELLIDGKPFLVKVLNNSSGQIRLWLHGLEYALTRPGVSAVSVSRTGALLPKLKSKVEGAVTSQVPGKVVLVRVKPGDKVEEGDTIFVMESMKMKSVVKAPKKGIVNEVMVKEGSSVSPGDLLVTLS